MNLFNIFRLIGSLMLLIAIADLPYSYYILLRISISSIAGYCIYSSYSQNNKTFTILFTGCLILFNPLIPIQLNRDAWAIIDICGFLLFILSILFIGDSYKKIQLKLYNVWHVLTSTIIKTVNRLFWPAIILISISSGAYYYFKYSKPKETNAINNLSENINLKPSSVPDKIQSPEIYDSSSIAEGNFLKSPYAYHDKNRKLIGLGNLSSEDAGICFTYSDTGRILKIAYDKELSLRIVGFTILTLSGSRIYINFDIVNCQKALCNADLYSIPNLIQENAVIIFSAYACGAAGRVNNLQSFIRTYSDEF